LSCDVMSCTVLYCYVQYLHFANQTTIIFYFIFIFFLKYQYSWIKLNIKSKCKRILTSPLYHYPIYLLFFNQIKFKLKFSQFVFSPHDMGFCYHALTLVPFLNSICLILFYFWERQNATLVPFLNSIFFWYILFFFCYNLVLC
jgi:hypothetical protein